MATKVETVPCPSCGHETYSKDEDGVIYCSESNKPVLACDALPIWQETAHQQAYMAAVDAAQTSGAQVPEYEDPPNLNPNAAPAESGSKSK